MNRISKLLTHRLLGALLLSSLVLPSISSRNASAAPNVKVIDITARRFSFTPNTITLKKGETVKLRLTSQDVTHGFFSRVFKLDEDLEPNETKEFTITPQEAGTYTIICDHFCGTNHGNMNMTVVVE
ncbi:MAG TPA: cupredoxin domain-containing protein [Terriglobales bacterium]